MHYVRVLRSPKAAKNRGKSAVELVFTITTDLGDAYLYPDEPIKLAVEVEVGLGPHAKPRLFGGNDAVVWASGMRVAKCTLEIPHGTESHIGWAPRSHPDQRQ